MIDNNIIQSLGAGSGIDTVSLTKQLTEIERAAPQQRIDTKRDKTETQISDFGLISSAMANLQDAAKTLTDPEGLFSKTASFTESNALVPVELGTDVQAGTYTFTVEEVASSQSLSSATFSDPSDAVGEGTLTFSFGKVSVDGSGAMLTTNGFEADADAEDVEITIDSSNNTLEGLRDAINDADFGVQATIINDGLNGYILQITAESGLNNQLEITVDEAGGAPSNTDDTGLSRFAFNETASQLVQEQAGADAKLTINGLEVYRESNSIDDIVPDLKLDVLQADPGVPITITVSDDKAFAEQSVRDFIESYNLFLEAIEPAVGITERENDEGETEKVNGSLANDPLARSMLLKIKSVIASAIPGLADSNFTSLGAVGIRTELDGSISIDEEAFTSAFDTNFEDIQKLFAPNLSTSDSSVYINSYNTNTAAGEYEVNVTTRPAKGSYQGANTAAIFPNFDATAKNYEFTVDVNGTLSDTITIDPAVYSDGDALASAIQIAINADTNISDAGGSVVVSYDSDNNRFDLTSNAYGLSSQVSIESTTADAEADFGFVTETATSSPGEGIYKSSSVNAVFPNYDSTGQTHEFSLEINGVLSNTISVPNAVYADQDAFATAIETAVNADANLSSGGETVVVTYNATTNKFEFESDSGGEISVISANADTEADLGILVATSATGSTAAGTIDGVSAFGSSNVLLPALGEPGEGLALVIGESATTATVNFSRGFAGELEALLEEFIGSNGLIATRETSLDTSLDKLDEEQEKLDRRMTAFEERLINQYIAMERIIGSLNTSGSFLDNLIDTLPFTASRD